MKVLLQAGHFPNAGGAPGEAQWTFDLAQLLAERLERAGITVAVIGDFYGKPPPVQVYQDWDLFLALHYDAAIYAARGEANTGAFCDRATSDPQAQKSDRFIAVWERVYPVATGIPLANHRRNANTNAYYAFTATTPNTPGVIIEHGCGALVGTGGFPPGEDGPFLHGSIAVVADANASAVLQYLDPTRGEEGVTPEQQRILDAAARNGLDDAGIDNLVGITSLLGQQKASLEELLRTSQAETAAQAAEAERLRALVTAQGASALTPEDAEKLAKYERIRELVTT